MVQNNKVLTVSYGTFSCTLEGFDDSFGTMKAIAEYFRDLASDDRYFGAEPPQPDADMLARIAQREIARQVEARTSDSGIHLRAAVPAAPAPAPAAPAPAAPVAAPVAAPAAATSELVETPPGEVDFFVEPEAAQQIVETPPGEVDFFVDPAVAKQQADDAPATEPEVAVDAYSIEGSVEEPFEDDFEDIAEEAEVAPPSDTLVETAPGEVDFFVAPEEAQKQAEAVNDDMVAADDTFVDQEPEPYSIEGSVEEPFDDELEGEDDVVAEDEGDVEAEVEDDIVAEVEVDVEAMEEEALIDLDQIAAVVAADKVDAPVEDDVVAEEIEAEPVVDEAPAKPAPNSIAAKLQRIRAVVSRTPVDEFSEDQHADAVSNKSADMVQDIAQDINTSLNADEPEVDEPEAFEEDNDALIARALEELQDAPEEDTSESVVEEAKTAPAAAPKEEAPAQPRRARVIKVRRGATKTAAQAPAEPAGPASTLSNADEDDLRRELAEVEAELLAATRADADAVAELATDDVELAETATSAAPETKEKATKDAADSDVSRLMAAADEKLEDPDTASSRESYGHMRAAVAAAQSDPETVAEDVEKEYREDLASAVHPRRPVVRRKSPRPESKEKRPTPLKLVAEQRIAEQDDAPKADSFEPAASAAPVRPRRVRTEAKPTTAEAFNSDTGFAKYVQETGAVELNELLEAAASYLSFVKGQDVFSRPELINKVRATGTEFNREDSMRSFGQLLRDGKIARKRNGRFSASEQIGFQPQGRAAG